MDLKDIKAIIDLMKKNAISEFELERQDFKIRLKRGALTVVPTGEEAPAPAYTSVASAPAQAALPPAAATTSQDTQIKAPMVGTFYRAPSPESPSYVEIGSEVTPETVVCIIEAMKVMNEIKAEVHGVITQALLENGKPVEYGQPLFRVRPL